MFCCLKAGFSVHVSNDILVKNRAKVSSYRACSSIQTLQFKEPNPRKFLSKTLDVLDQKPVTSFNTIAPELDPVSAQTSIRWWEKPLHPNMIEIDSAQELVDFLFNAGNRLVVLNFYSPGCGGCKTLHPKICQLAEMNSKTIFLKVNYEQHQAMCNALNVHVLPFFRFYRGEEGRICSFSCTNATIKKLKDALANHGTDSRCLGPAAKGLDESELLALASMGLITRNLGAKFSRG